MQNARMTRIIIINNTITAIIGMSVLVIGGGSGGDGVVEFR